MAADDDQAPAKPVANTAERFKKWLQLLEAHGQRRTADQVAKPRCVHGNVWDQCGECPPQEGQA